MGRVIQKTIDTLECIKFSHSIFALPFALASMLVAAQGWPDTKRLLLILLCMVSARSAAMAFNRLADADMDAKNPRTQNRHLPQGLLTKKYLQIFVGLTSALFLIGAHFLNSLAFFLSPLALLFFFAYSFTKRFTWMSQLWLGASLGLSPLGAWIAVTGEWPWPAISLSLAVLFWVAGFDTIYATQDFEFDKKEGLHSLVVQWGLKKSLWIARLFHFFTLLFLIFFGWQHEFHIYYWITLFCIAAGFFYEHSLISPDNLSKVNAAFFQVNGIIGLLFFAGVACEILW